MEQPTDLVEQLKTLRLLQEIYEAQGFLVLASRSPYQIGEVRKGFNLGAGLGRHHDGAVVIVGIATHEEWRRQHQFAPQEIEPGVYPYYWKVKAE